VRGKITTKTRAESSRRKKNTKKRVKPKRFLAKDLKVFREILINLKEDLLNKIRDISEDTLMKSQKDISGDISGYSLHMADVASDNYERDFNLNLMSNEHKILFQIDEALKRIEDKTYGICLSCNKNIAKGRLKAIPYARYCAKCKERLEKENRI